MTRSLIVPGLGKFYTGRPVLGLFMAAWGGALGLAMLSQEVTIECLERVTDTCPSNQVRSEVTRRPILAVGAGGAVAIAVISALEASSAAKRANGRPGGDDTNALNNSPVIPSISAWPSGALALGLRLRVW